MKYRNRIPEPGTTISGFADNKKKKKTNNIRATQSCSKLGSHWPNKKRLGDCLKNR
jgi:hypothetical protein